MLINDQTIRFTGVLEELISRRIVKNDRQFAISIGVSPAMVNEIRKGRTNISYEKIKIVADKFNVNIDYILNGKGEIFAKFNYKNPLKSLKSVKKIRIK